MAFASVFTFLVALLLPVPLCGFREDAEESRDSTLGAVSCDARGAGKKMWHVFVEHLPLRLSYLTVDHTEVLLCRLSGADRETLGLPSEVSGEYGVKVQDNLWRADMANEYGRWDAVNYSDPTHPQLRECVGVSFSTAGVLSHTKKLGDRRFFGASGDCDAASKYFRGCIHTRKDFYSGGQVKLDKTGRWVMDMLRDMSSCQGNWGPKDYVGFHLQSKKQHNCNSFSEHILDCELGLGSKLVPMYSPKLSDGGSGRTHTCECNDQGAFEFQYMNWPADLDINTFCHKGSGGKWSSTSAIKSMSKSVSKSVSHSVSHSMNK